jgi:uncharacterized protein YkwD
MVRITCPKCGGGTDNPSQKFCISCGAELSSIQSPAPAGNPAGIPVWILAGAGILVIVVAAVILLPFLMQMISGTSSAGLVGTGQAQPVTISPGVTPLPEATPLPVTTLPETTITTVATTVPITITTQTTVPRTRAMVSQRPTFTVATPSTTTSAGALVPEVTSQITLAETQIPQQPPAASYISTTPGAPVIDHSALEARIHEQINAQRQQNGLSDLSYDSFLADIARGHSYDMVLRNYFDHVDPDGNNAKARGDEAGYPCIRGYRNYYTKGLSENLYQGHRGSTYLTEPNGTIVTNTWNSLDQIANMAVNGWMNSEGHRKNILNGNFQQEGIGVAFSADDKIYVTENFC